MKTLLRSATLVALLSFGAHAFAAAQASPAAQAPAAKPAAVAPVAKPAVAATARPAPCHDAKGKFTKCPAAAPASRTCRDASGKFAKCPA